MWLFSNKKNRALRSWHSRAMLVDLRKITMTTINAKELPLHDPRDTEWTEDGVIATPVEVLVDTWTREAAIDAEEACFSHSAVKMGTEGEVIATPVAVFQYSFLPHTKPFFRISRNRFSHW